MVGYPFYLVWGCLRLAQRRKGYEEKKLTTLAESEGIQQVLNAFTQGQTPCLVHVK